MLCERLLDERSKAAIQDCVKLLGRRWLLAAVCIPPNILLGYCTMSAIQLFTHTHTPVAYEQQRLPIAGPLAAYGGCAVCCQKPEARLDLQAGPGRCGCTEA